MRDLKQWPGRHVLELDLRSLALTRFTLGLVLALDSFIRWRDLSEHYTDYGVLPRGLLLDYGWNPNFVSLHMMSGEPFWMHLLALLQVGLALCLSLGFQTRLASVLCWFLLVSIHSRNPWIINGGDVYLRVILFWGTVLPWGERWSWDAASGRSDQRWWTAQILSPETVKRSFAGLGFLLQVCLLYWFAALQKIHPSWVADGTAIDIALRLDQLVKPFGVFFRELFAPVLPFLTRSVLAWETWAPFLLWFPFDRGQVRTLTIFGFIGMHLGFELTMELGMFPLICMVVPLALLPAWFWDGIGKKIDVLVTRKFPAQTVESSGLGASSRGLNRTREVILAFLCLYILSWNFGNEQVRPRLWLPDSLKAIGYTLRLDQRWAIFSPSPPYQDGWWVIRARKRDGSILELSPGRQTELWSKPEYLSQVFKRQRQRRWMMEMRATGSQELMKSYCRFVARKLNGSERSLHEVSEIKLYFMLEITRADGTEEPAKKFLQFHYYVFRDVPNSEVEW